MDPLVAVTALKRLWMPLLVNGSTVRALVDTGSTLSYFGEKAGKLVADHLVPHKINMRVANGQITQTDGIVDTQMTVDGLTRDLRINVSAALDYEAVLGMDFLEKFKISLLTSERKWKGASDKTYSFEEPPNPKS